MPWYRRLRWRLIGSQFLVALVGVGLMMLATRVIILRTAPQVIRPELVALLEDPLRLADIELRLIIAFRNAVLLSVVVAATGAVVAGVASSVLLWRTIIAPLRQVAASSRRIADGRYDERVPEPRESGEAMEQLVTSFNQMAGALEQTEQQRVALLANVTHELRTPLTALQGYLEGLLDGLFPANEETFSWMSHEVDRLSRLVEDIQNLSRVEAGEFSLRFAEFNVNEIAERVRAQLAPQAQAKQVQLQAELPPEAVFVTADADRTAQVLINLTGNAIRYTPAGGEITIRITADRRTATVAVQDSGVGIPVGALPYLFERFYRVDASRSRISGGSGIGLTIARHLVWAMGGEIWAESPGEGQGSTFSFSLPRSG